MTAEGDNRVLMQKIAKDLLSNQQKDRYHKPALTMCPIRQIPNMESINESNSIEVLSNLIYYREEVELKAIMDLIQQKIMVEGKEFFQIWMYELSDQIQSLSQAFAERTMLESALVKMNECKHVQTKECI